MSSTAHYSVSTPVFDLTMTSHLQQHVNYESYTSNCARREVVSFWDRRPDCTLFHVYRGWKVPRQGRKGRREAKLLLLHLGISLSNTNAKLLDLSMTHFNDSIAESLIETCATSTTGKQKRVTVRPSQIKCVCYLRTKWRRMSVVYPHPNPKLYDHEDKRCRCGCPSAYLRNGDNFVYYIPARNKTIVSNRDPISSSVRRFSRVPQFDSSLGSILSRTKVSRSS